MHIMGTYTHIYEISYDILIFPDISSTDIQEFYEVTLLNSQKSCEQKIEEANQVAQKWEKTLILDSCRDSLQKSSEVCYRNSSEMESHIQKGLGPSLEQHSTVAVKWQQ